MMHTSLKQIEVKKNILEDPKYDYLFSVDTLNEMVLNGVPFRDAYKKMGAAIEAGTFRPVRDAKHTHEGSLGNLCLEEIRLKMDAALSD
jgi:argininosuccinate lyase